MAITATDASGNVTTQNRVVTVRGTEALAYDASGNTTLRTWQKPGPVDYMRETYTWDAENRLTGWEKRQLAIAGQQADLVLASATWQYDGLGRRVKEHTVVGAAATDRNTVWDGMEMVQWQNTDGTAQRNLFGEGEQNIATGEKLIYITDHLGSVRAWHRLSDGARGTAQFSAYGKRTISSNATGVPARSFTGHYQHEASGLILAPYRAYDAELGRWPSRDPIGKKGGVNLYGFVGNNPIRRIDRLGRVGLESIGTPAMAKNGIQGFAGVWFTFSRNDASVLGGSGNLVWSKRVDYEIHPCNTALLSYEGTRTMWFNKPFTLAGNGTITSGRREVQGIVAQGLDIDVMSLSLDGVINFDAGQNGQQEGIKECGSHGKITSVVDWAVTAGGLLGGTNELLSLDIWGYDNSVTHAPTPPNGWDTPTGAIASGTLKVVMEWNQCNEPKWKKMTPTSSVHIQGDGPNRPGKRDQKGDKFPWQSP